MKNYLRKFFLAAVGICLGYCVFFPKPAQAISFNFSYTFESGETLSGTVDGDLVDGQDLAENLRGKTLITNLRNLRAIYSGLHLIFDEIPIINSPNILTFDGSLMYFFGSDEPGEGIEGKGVFGIVPLTENVEDTFIYLDEDGDFENLNDLEKFLPPKWTLQEIPTVSVPEPTMIRALLFLGLVALKGLLKKSTFL